MGMVIKNLLRRKGRTLLTIIGISIGVAAIVSLGAFARGLKSGYRSMITGSNSDLVLSQPAAYDISMSAIDEKIGDDIETMPEVTSVSSMLQGIVKSEGNPYFFIFGYPKDSFILKRFIIAEGASINSQAAQRTRGKPLMLGSAAAETLKKKPGDTLRLMDSVFRVIGIYQTGNAFEDSGAVVLLDDAQNLLNRKSQVSLFYIRLKEPGMRQQLQARIERDWPNVEINDARDLSEKQMMGNYLEGMVWVIAGLAIVIGGIGMVNAQLMAVFERTREIGVLRAVGWRSRQVMGMILGETIIVSIFGGITGVGVGYAVMIILSNFTSLYGVSPQNINITILAQAGIVILALGLFGGIYPAWQASRLEPIEALRYEGGSRGGRIHHLPFGGMSTQNLIRRKTRTILTLSVISITIGAVIVLDAMMQGMQADFTEIAIGAGAEISIRQANVADTGLSVLDQRLSLRIASLPQVASVSSLIFTAVQMPEAGSFFILQGYQPQSQAIKRFRVVEGQVITGNRQMLLGSVMADILHKHAGDSITLGNQRFRIVGIYESKISWEQFGGVISLRDAQIFTGKPRQVTMLGVKLRDPNLAKATVQEINRRFPEAYASLSSEFAEQTPDMQNSNSLISGTAILALVVGGLGVMNTMLMSVLERTREIGVLRALGWRRRAVIRMILKESLLLGIIGGLLGIITAFILAYLLNFMPAFASMFSPLWKWDIFIKAIGVALALGIVGGIYPAYRATLLQPIEALHYE